MTENKCSNGVFIYFDIVMLVLFEFFSFNISIYIYILYSKSSKPLCSCRVYCSKRTTHVIIGRDRER